MKRMKNTRLIIQTVVLITAVISALNHYLNSIGKGISWISESIFHYICPTCGVVSIYQFFASSSLWTDKLKSILGLTIGGVLISAILLGPVICGFICPFGAIQDLVSRIGKKLFKNKYNKFIPSHIDSRLKYIRYAVLAATVVLTAKSSVMLIEGFNPYHAFLSLFNRKSMSLMGAVILGIVMIASLGVQRPWCKYLCPYGAFLGLFNKLKVFRIVRKESSCIHCKKCNKECPMGIEVEKMEEVRDVRCISCMDCVSECPKEEALAFGSEDLEEIKEKSINQ